MGMNGTKRILIVDDEVGFLLALRKILQGPGVDIDTADTLEGAMALLRRHIYHVVIADIRLTMISEEEGIEILRHIKKETPASKVIMISGHGNDAVMDRIRTLGADLFFEKPVSSEILKNTLRCWGILC
jgi:DNA-binding NtrC family response regulator